jgi:hypothetical protein
MHCCYLITKNNLGLKKIQKKWKFKLGNSCYFLVHLLCTYLINMYILKSLIIIIGQFVGNFWKIILKIEMK